LKFHSCTKCGKKFGFRDLLKKVKYQNRMETIRNNVTGQDETYEWLEIYCRNCVNKYKL